MKQWRVGALPVLFPKCHVCIKHISLVIGAIHLVYWSSAFLLFSTIVSIDMSILQDMAPSGKTSTNTTK